MARNNRIKGAHDPELSDFLDKNLHFGDELGFSDFVGELCLYFDRNCENINLAEKILEESVFFKVIDEYQKKATSIDSIVRVIWLIHDNYESREWRLSEKYTELLFSISPKLAWGHSCPDGRYWLIVNGVDCLFWGRGIESDQNTAIAWIIEQLNQSDIFDACQDLGRLLDFICDDYFDGTAEFDLVDIVKNFYSYDLDEKICMTARKVAQGSVLGQNPTVGFEILDWIFRSKRSLGALIALASVLLDRDSEFCDQGRALLLIDCIAKDVLSLRGEELVRKGGLKESYYGLVMLRIAGSLGCKEAKRIVDEIDAGYVQKIELVERLLAGDRQDAVDGLNIFEDLAQLDHDAAFRLASSLLDGNKLYGDRGRGLEILEQLSEFSPDAKWSLADRLLDGVGMPKDSRRGRALLEELAKTSNRARMELAERLASGRGLTKDLHEARSILQYLSRKGYEPATLQIENLCGKDA